VDEYLRLRHGRAASSPAAKAATAATAGGDGNAGPAALAGSDLRAVRKEVASIERRLDKLTVETKGIHQRMADHDHGDYEGLQRLADRLRAVQDETAALEERWLELSELVD
jgi:hypothetical protein